MCMRLNDHLIDHCPIWAVFLISQISITIKNQAHNHCQQKPRKNLEIQQRNTWLKPRNLEDLGLFLA